MARHAAPIDLSPEDRSALEQVSRAPSSPQVVAQRARMILMAGDGARVDETAARFGGLAQDGRSVAGALARRFRLRCAGVGAFGRCAALRGAGADHGRADLRDRGAGLRATIG